MSDTTRVAAVGGGHGLAATLQALRHLDIAPTAVVTVADDGGSSGRLRDDLNIIAVGDLRMALLALATSSPLADLAAHRFGRGVLAGHAVGNLMLLALAEQQEDFVAALDQLGALLGVTGRVLPCTTCPVTLHARIDGRRVDGQVTIARTAGRREALWLDPLDPPACSHAVRALRAADVVMFGPGSLYTSVIANLLVPGIADAVASTTARLVYVANLTTQPGETDGLDADGHVAALTARLGGRTLDAVVLHDGPIGGGGVRGGPGTPLGTSLNVDVAVHTADVASRDPAGGHDPVRLAAALRDLVVGSSA